MKTQNRVELSHKLTVLHNWAFNPDLDTISALTEKEAKDITYKINEIWRIIDRRKKKV